MLALCELKNGEGGRDGGEGDVEAGLHEQH
jgi:hypothetical protein